jgi:hypothetical protein
MLQPDVRSAARNVFVGCRNITPELIILLSSALNPSDASGRADRISREIPSANQFPCYLDLIPLLFGRSRQPALGGPDAARGGGRSGYGSRLGGYGDSALFVLHSQRCIADGINGLDPLAASKGRRPGSNPRVQPLIGGIFPLLSLC